MFVIFTFLKQTAAGALNGTARPPRVTLLTWGSRPLTLTRRGSALEGLGCNRELVFGHVRHSRGQTNRLKTPRGGCQTRGLLFRTTLAREKKCQQKKIALPSDETFSPVLENVASEK